MDNKDTTKKITGFYVEVVTNGFILHEDAPLYADLHRESGRIKAIKRYVFETKVGLTDYIKDINIPE